MCLGADGFLGMMQLGIKHAIPLVGSHRDTTFNEKARDASHCYNNGPGEDTGAILFVEGFENFYKPVSVEMFPASHLIGSAELILIPTKNDPHPISTHETMIYA